MEDSNTRRIVLIGKSGSGKSSLANTIFGAPIFDVNHSSDSKSKFSQAQTRTVDELNLTLIDTPGIFNTDLSGDEIQCEIFSCLIHCSPGPHAFILVLLVEKFTEQEQAIVDQVQMHFGDEVFQYTTVVFTHGDQLPGEMKIDEFVAQSKGLRELVRKCGERCHVIDNKYWKNTKQNDYRSNTFQRREILSSIALTCRQNNNGFFINSTLQQVEADIQKEQERICKSRGQSAEESRDEAKQIVLQKYIQRQQLKRYLKYILIGAGFSGVAYMLIAKVVSFFSGGNVVSASGPDANEVLAPSVVEVVQEVVTPIKGTLDYIIETIEAVFKRAAWLNANKTQGA